MLLPGLLLPKGLGLQGEHVGGCWRAQRERRSELIALHPLTSSLCDSGDSRLKTLARSSNTATSDIPPDFTKHGFS